MLSVIHLFIKFLVIVFNNFKSLLMSCTSHILYSYKVNFTMYLKRHM